MFRPKGRNAGDFRPTDRGKVILQRARGVKWENGKTPPWQVASHGRYVAFQMAEVAIPRNLFADIPADDWGIAAAARYIDWVMRSVVTRSTKNHGRRAS